MKTKQYRTQHEEIYRLVESIEQHLSVETVSSRTEEVAGIARELFGKFGIHLALEDRVLYPQAAAHNDGSLRVIAQRFQKEMGGLAERFELYRKAWPGSIAIAHDPNGFVRETLEVIQQLRNRLRREEQELYLAIDRVG